MRGKKNNSPANWNPLVSSFWIPLICLPVIILWNKPQALILPQPPRDFYQKHIDFMNQRNAVVSYWDKVHSRIDRSRTPYIFKTLPITTQLIEVKALESDSDNLNHNYTFEVSTGTGKSQWTLVSHPQYCQLIRMNDEISRSSNFRQKMLHFQLEWSKSIDISKIDSSDLDGLKTLIVSMHDLQFRKALKQLEIWADAQAKLNELLSKPSLTNLRESLQNYLNYQKALLILEIAARTNSYNIKNNILFAHRFQLIQKFKLEESNLFDLPASSMKLEMNVIIGADNAKYVSTNFVRQLCNEARTRLKLFDLETAPWSVVTALARSYQMEAKSYDSSDRRFKSLNEQARNLLVPEKQSSLAIQRAKLQPQGADFNLNGSEYLQRLALNLHDQYISLQPEDIEHDTQFSESIQTVQLNGRDYVLDSLQKSVFELDQLHFKEVAKLPDQIAPLSQAVVQPDPESGQPRLILLGGFPENNSVLTSKDMSNFQFLTNNTTVTGRFYFGLAQFRSSQSGIENTLLIGGISGRKNQPPQFKDILSSVDATNWKHLNTLNWSNRLSFAMIQLKERMLLMGGCGSYQEGPCYAQIWSSTDGKSFEKFTDAPWSPRGAMAVVNTPTGLLLFGGADQNTVFSDIWRSNDGKKWTQIPIQTSGSMHSKMIYREDRLWILGGLTQSGNTAPTRSFRIIQDGIQFL